MSIRVVMPTRGLIYAQTLQSLKDNDISLDDIIFGSGEIPHIQNQLTKQAIDAWPTHVLFVEDDMVIPTGAINKMINANAAIVAVEYPIDNGYSTVTRHNGEVLWCGLGCTLVNSRVLTNMGEPWFENHYSYQIQKPEFGLKRVEIPNKYGGHDVNFCMKARALGYEIQILQDFEAQHLRSDAVIRTQSNRGAYQIKPLDPIQIRHDFGG